MGGESTEPMDHPDAPVWIGVVTTEGAGHYLPLQAQVQRVDIQHPVEFADLRFELKGGVVRVIHKDHEILVSELDPGMMIHSFMGIQVMFNRNPDIIRSWVITRYMQLLQVEPNDVFEVPIDFKSMFKPD